MNPQLDLFTPPATPLSLFAPQLPTLRRGQRVRCERRVGARVTAVYTGRVAWATYEAVSVALDGHEHSYSMHVPEEVTPLEPYPYAER